MQQYIFAPAQTPSGALASVHRLIALRVITGDVMVTVNSYADENQDHEQILYQGVYPIPMEAFTALTWPAGVLDWAVSPDGWFPGGELVDDATTLENEKAKKRAAIRYARNVAEWAGCETPFGKIDTDPDSQRKIGGSVSAATILGEDFTIDWRMQDDSIVTFDASTMISVGLLVAQHVAARQARKNACDAQIEAAETVEDVQAITWDVAV